MRIRSGIVPNHIILFEKHIINLDSILVAVPINQSTLRGHPEVAIVPKVTVQKRRNELCRRVRGIVVIQHDGDRRLNKFTEFAIAKGDRSRLVGQERMISRSDKHKAFEDNVFDGIVTDAQDLSPIHVQIASPDPAAIFPQALVSTLERHVGAKGNRRVHGPGNGLNEVAIEIEISDIENVSWADGIHTGEGSVLVQGFPGVDLV